MNVITLPHPTPPHHVKPMKDIETCKMLVRFSTRRLKHGCFNRISRPVENSRPHSSLASPKSSGNRLSRGTHANRVRQSTSLSVLERPKGGNLDMKPKGCRKLKGTLGEEKIILKQDERNKLLRDDG